MDGALFLIDFQHSADQVAAFCAEDPAHLWAIRAVSRSDSSDGWKSLSLRHLEFVVDQFAECWPPEHHPSGGWSGDENPWDAAEFIRAAIGALGADNSGAASEVLNRLADNPRAAAYRDEIKHVRARQQRLRRDTEYRPPSFTEVKAVLTGGLPGNVDDLKAATLDALERVQTYVQQGDTRAWEAYWTGSSPKDENTCRDRLLDALRGYMPTAIALIPETRMPNAKRADLVALYNGNGLPMEIKGQWHSDVWDASTVQLIEKYTNDWRADGRGIYIVLWFGHVPGKMLPKHPEGRSLPSTSEQLRLMLIDRLDPAELARVDVFVLDVSRS